MQRGKTFETGGSAEIRRSGSVSDRNGYETGTGKELNWPLAKLLTPKQVAEQLGVSVDCPDGPYGPRNLMKMTWRVSLDFAAQVVVQDQS